LFPAAPLQGIVVGFALHQASVISTNFAPTTPSFSISSALLPKRTYLTENARHNHFSNSFNFNHFHTLFHFSPATALFTISSPKHTEGVPLRSQFHPLETIRVAFMRARNAVC
jgi:hypothetical protein